MEECKFLQRQFRPSIFRLKAENCRDLKPKARILQSLVKGWKIFSQNLSMKAQFRKIILNGSIETKMKS